MLTLSIFVLVIFHVNSHGASEFVLPKPDGVTLPGTKWCGPGNTSTGYDDLGEYRETDACCRTHDYGECIVGWGGTMYNLTNNSFFCRMHCSADEEFYECLKSIKLEKEKQMAENVGVMYFNLNGMYTKCFKEEYPTIGCKTYHTWENKRGVKLRRCVEYIFDDSKPKKYQWFDIRFYV